MPDFNADRQQAAQWAKQLISRPDWCILDTETTGFTSNDEICQIAIIDPNGTTLINSLVRPTSPISAEATEIHGITDERVRDSHAPTFEELFIPILKAIGRRDVIAYSCDFDLRFIRQSARAHNIHLAFPTSDRRGCRVWIGGGGVYCAMQPFAEWCGQWSDHHGGYKWQKLPGGDHTALGDCHATLELIRRMAASYQPDPEPEPHSAPPKISDSAKMTVFHAAPLPNDCPYDDIPF